jgi:hemerythrin-like domain-containing protein
MMARDKPADTTMMGVVHDALRRDLIRLKDGLGTTPPPGDDRHKALAEHAEWMMNFLDDHHHGEDGGLWPLLRERAPHAGALLDRMTADHQRIGAAIEQTRLAAEHYRMDSGDDARAQFLAALATLAESLLPHLRSEEDEAMPLVSATITDAEWKQWDNRQNIRGKSISKLADEGHWLMDDLDRDRYETLTHLVPAPVRVVILKGYRRRYRTNCARRWGPHVFVGPRNGPAS